MSSKAKTTGMKTAAYVLKAIFHLLVTILFYSAAIIVIIKLCSVTYMFTYQVFGNQVSEPKPGHAIEITIDKGESTMSVAGKLELKKAIVNKYSFFLKTKLFKKTIQPGTYKISTSMNYDEILNVITGAAALADENKKRSSGS